MMVDWRFARSRPFDAAIGETTATQVVEAAGKGGHSSSHSTPKCCHGFPVSFFPLAKIANQCILVMCA